tara:strand:+ start:2003 stop:2590 length:588 start_codon:yes stop_codon:yes gene_type:complete
MRQPRKNKRTGLSGGYSNNRRSSFLTDIGSSLKKIQDAVYNPKRSQGYVKAGKKWVSKDTKSMAKDVMKHDVDFNKFNSYASKSGRLKKSGTRKSRMQDAADLVIASKKEKREGDDSLYNTYATLGEQKTKTTPTTSNVTASTTPTETTASTTKKPAKKNKSQRSSVSLSSLGVSLNYYKQGGQMKRTPKSGQHD